MTGNVSEEKKSVDTLNELKQQIQHGINNNNNNNYILIIIIMLSFSESQLAINSPYHKLIQVINNNNNNGY